VTTPPLRLLLLRHGQTHGNGAGALDTAEPGLDLTELGRAQADAAARALTHEPIEAVYVSSRVRTHQTAAPLAASRGVDPVQLDGLEEVAAGDYEMASDEDAVKGYVTTVASWIDGDLAVRMPGGETGDELLARYDAAVARVAGAGHRCALVVSHGAAIRTWVSLRVGAGDDPGAHQHLHNTACIVVEGRPGDTWRLVSWHGDPVGGDYLEDPAAPDPTGDDPDQVDDPDEVDEVDD
jgi:probable phosphoglycerate mutase